MDKKILIIAMAVGCLIFCHSSAVAAALEKTVKKSVTPPLHHWANALWPSVNRGGTQTFSPEDTKKPSIRKKSIAMMGSIPKDTRSVEIDGSPLKSLEEDEEDAIDAIDATAHATKKSTKQREDEEESIHRSRFQNLVLENAARAYQDHPNDIDGYRNALRESLKDYPIPPNHRHKYEAILLDGEARYFYYMSRDDTTRGVKTIAVILKNSILWVVCFLLIAIFLHIFIK